MKYNLTRWEWTLLSTMILGAVLGTSLGASRSASADHISEPTAPITGIGLQLAHYSSGTIIECGTVASALFRNLRVDPIVIASARPSEHFTGKVIWHSQSVRIWNGYQKWDHSNVPPDARSLRWVGGQGQLALEPGNDYTVTWEVTGDVSGNHFSETCTFTTAAG